MSLSRAKVNKVVNADLAGARVYSSLDQKNVTAWLGLRNDAAHGHYNEYTGEQVALMLQGVRDFITRHPACYRSYFPSSSHVGELKPPELL